MKLIYNKEKIIVWCVIFIIFLNSLTNLFKSLTEIVNLYSLLRPFLILSRLLCWGMGCFVLIEKINKKALGVIGFIGSLVCFSFIFFPENNQFLLPTSAAILSNCLLVLLLFEVEDYGYFFKQLTRVSFGYYIIIVLLFIVLMKRGVLGLFGTDYMIFSYAFLPFICCFIYNWFKTKKIIYLGGFLFGFLIISIWGCRGAVISSVACFFIYLLQESLSLKRFYSLMIFCCLSMMILSMTLLNIQYLKDSFNEIGIKSRMINKLVSGSISPSRGRMYQTVWNEVCLQPLIPRGINADYNLFGLYSHNIFVELLYDFGLILGSLFSLLLVLASFITIISYKNTDYNKCVVFFFSIGFIKLLVSSSLFIEPLFFCWLTLVTKRINVKRICCH